MYLRVKKYVTLESAIFFPKLEIQDNIHTFKNFRDRELRR